MANLDRGATFLDLSSSFSFSVRIIDQRSLRLVSRFPNLWSLKPLLNALNQSKQNGNLEYAARLESILQFVADATIEDIVLQKPYYITCLVKGPQKAVTDPRRCPGIRYMLAIDDFQTALSAYQQVDTGTNLLLFRRRGHL